MSVSDDTQPTPAKGNALWLDTSSLETSIALLQDGRLLTHRTSETNTLDFLFSGLAGCLREQDLAFQDLGTIYYCEGPGSSLGLRIAAMALKTWKATHPGLRLSTCRSLPLHAALLAHSTETPECFTLVAQHRKGTWFSLQYDCNDGSRLEMNTLSDEEIPEIEGPVYHMKQRKFATEPPAHFLPLETSLEALPEILKITGLFRKVDHPEFFDTGIPPFKKWTPQRHR